MRTFALLLTLALALPPPAAAAEPEPIFRLPDFTVTDSSVLPKPEAWRHAEVAGFEVLSNASDRAANRLLKNFARFRQALDLTWLIPMRRPVSSTLILAGRGDKFADFLPPASRTSAAGVASLFLRDREQAALVLDLGTADFAMSGSDQPADGANATVRLEIDPSRQLDREYLRFLFSQSDRPLPPWYQEGLAQIFMDMQITDKTVVFTLVEEAASARNQLASAPASLPDDADAALAARSALEQLSPPKPADATGGLGFGQEFAVGDRPFNVALRNRRLMPLDEFFTVTADSPAARNPLGDNLWAKQCYAFVHLCLYGEFERYKLQPGSEQTLPSTLVALARLRLDEARAAPRAPGGQLDREQVAAVLAPLQTARTRPPPQPGAYLLLAEAWTASAVPPTRADLAVVNEGIKRFPSLSPLVRAAIRLDLRIGERAHAAGLARLGAFYAPDAASKAEFEALAATLPLSK